MACDSSESTKLVDAVSLQEKLTGVCPKVICPQKPFLQGAFLWIWALSGMSALLRSVW